MIDSDASSIPAQQALAKTAEGAFGKLDVLCVNAGIVDMRPLEEWDEAGFDRSLGINFKGPFFLIQALLPIFGNPASIVLTTSINAHVGMPNTSIYGASKAALLSLAHTLSGELIGRGIRVNAVSPGPISTPLYDKLGMISDEQKSGLAGQIPARRFGTPARWQKQLFCLPQTKRHSWWGASW